jgi:hypothetical protein
LPILVFIYKKTEVVPALARTLFVQFFLAGTAICWAVTQTTDEGALPIGIIGQGGVNNLNTVTFEYLNDIYMKPYFWINVYVFGVALCFVFADYSKDLRQGRAQSPKASLATKMMNALANKPKLRYAGYVLGIVMIFAAYAWLYPLYSNAANQSKDACAMFAAMTNVLVVVGFSMFLLPALGGKAAMFTYVCGSGFFLSLSNLCAMMMILGPVVCLWFYLSTGSPLAFTYYIQQYNWDNNLFFAFVFALIFSLLTDKPIRALLSLSRDREEANRLDNNNSIAALKNQKLSDLYHSISDQQDKLLL